jgi:hypothetical protein
MQSLGRCWPAVPALVALAHLAAPAPARADFMMTLEESGVANPPAPLTITDTNNTGRINFSGRFGDFSGDLSAFIHGTAVLALGVKINDLAGNPQGWQTLCRVCFVVLLVAALFPSGCNRGPKTAPVRGRVTYEGKPVPNGAVAFIPEGGTTATGEIGPDGAYTLTTFRKGDGAVLGAHKVVITALDAGKGGEAAASLPAPLIPVKYMNLATTDLRAEVKDRENIIDFDLRARRGDDRSLLRSRVAGSVGGRQPRGRSACGHQSNPYIIPRSA